MPTYEHSTTVEIERDGERIYVHSPREPQHWIVLEGSAAAVWDELEAPGDPNELAARLTRRFDGDPAEISRDLEATLAEWDQLGLVRVHA